MTENKKFILALGTNINHEMNMFLAEHLLKKMLPSIVFTESKWTEPIGFTSDNKFLNELGFGYTSHGTAQMERAIKHIERECGSIKAERSKGIVTMDIDILLIGETKFHNKDWNRNYIKELLKDDPY
jgi:2-amino-4-hydroxy-6-hydroxymethyldihydropteridine diphosphokinase